MTFDVKNIVLNVPIGLYIPNLVSNDRYNFHDRFNHIDNSWKDKKQEDHDPEFCSWNCVLHSHGEGISINLDCYYTPCIHEI